MKIIVKTIKLSFILTSGIVHSKYIKNQGHIDEIKKYPWCYVSALFDWDPKGPLYTLTEGGKEFEFRESEIDHFTVSKLLIPKVLVTF